MRIFYLVELLSPYRVVWMNMLSEEHEVCAYYFDESDKTRNEEWLQSIQKSFISQHVKNTVFAGIRFSKDLFRIIQEEQFDIYIIDGYASFAQVRVIHKLTKENKTVFINVDGIDIWKKDKLFSKIKKLIKSSVYSSGARFLCGSKIAASKIVESGAKEKNVFVHPFTSLFEKDIVTFQEKTALQKAFKCKINAENKQIVLAVGRFIPLKRYEILIKAWKNMPDYCVLFLIGEGELRTEYEKQIMDLGITNILICDYMNKEKLNNYYLSADLFVHTSETEVWGLVINEAMAKGCPVISTNHCVGGVELIRDGEEGFVVEVGNVEELHNRMLEIINNESLKKKMMSNVIERIKPYTYENVAKTHLKIFETVVNV